MFTDYGFSEEQVRLLHKLMDDDGDGSLTFEEWWQWLNTKGKLTLVEDDNKFFFLKAAADMFNEADKDGDGSVTRAECGEMLAMQWEMEPHSPRLGPASRFNNLQKICKKTSGAHGQN